MSEKRSAYNDAIKGLIRIYNKTITVAEADMTPKAAAFILTYYTIEAETFALMSTYPLSELNGDFKRADSVHLDLVPGKPDVLSWCKRKFAAGELTRHQQTVFYSEFIK